MMLRNPPPAQQPVIRDGDSGEGPPLRTGQSTPARLVKACLRPPLKLGYYALLYPRQHKVVTGLALLLLLMSIVITVRLTTEEWPFGIGGDPFQVRTQAAQGRDVGDKVKGWLYALRKGDATALQLASSTFASPLDAGTLSQYIASLSATDTRQWGKIQVLSVQPQEDTTIDYFVSVDITTNGPGGKNKAVAYFYFVTVPDESGERLLRADYLFMRAIS